MAESFSYARAGIDISATDAIKRDMAQSMDSDDPRLLNRPGAFGSLYDAHFPELRHPVLVLKTEEPGSKQKLAAGSGRIRSVCFDMINHLVNDIVVMGARPLTAQDAIILGKTQPALIKELVSGIAEACRANDCVLSGGETSVQPGVLSPDTFILSSSIVGVVDRDRIIDGSRIVPGNVVLALASNGLHTNGYTLVRALLENDAGLADFLMPADEYNAVGGEYPVRFEPGSPERFFDVIMRPHRPYYHLIREHFGNPGLTGLAHITGGGIQDNLNRILPAGTYARIDRGKIRVLPVFAEIRKRGNVSDDEMLRTFNCGVGLCVVCDKDCADDLAGRIRSQGCATYVIGEILSSGGAAAYEKSVVFEGNLDWMRGSVPGGRAET